MFEGQGASLLRDKFIEDRFLGAYGVTDSTSANPVKLIKKEHKTGPDCSVIIAKVRETVSVVVKNPVTLFVWCENPNVSYDMIRDFSYNDYTYVCYVGPMNKPLVSTILIDNKKIPIIVTE
jgi:hypothetical protein